MRLDREAVVADRLVCGERYRLVMREIAEAMVAEFTEVVELIYNNDLAIGYEHWGTLSFPGRASVVQIHINGYQGYEDEPDLYISVEVAPDEVLSRAVDRLNRDLRNIPLPWYDNLPAMGRALLNFFMDLLLDVSPQMELESPASTTRTAADLTSLTEQSTLSTVSFKTCCRCCSFYFIAEA